MEQQLTCPATGEFCPGKAIVNSFIENVPRARSFVHEGPVPRTYDSEQAQDFRAQACEELDRREEALLRDLGATCSGEVCGPLVETASRFPLGGHSYSEALQLSERQAAASQQ